MPSVAIKEGVYKSLQMTDDHFRALYSGESYEEFAENLQHEIEEDTGMRFGVIEVHRFAQIPVTGDGGETTVLGFEKSQALYDHLQAINSCKQRALVDGIKYQRIGDEAYYEVASSVDQLFAEM